MPHIAINQRVLISPSARLFPLCRQLCIICGAAGPSSSSIQKFALHCLESVTCVIVSRYFHTFSPSSFSFLCVFRWLFMIYRRTLVARMIVAAAFVLRLPYIFPIIFSCTFIKVWKHVCSQSLFYLFGSMGLCMGFFFTGWRYNFIVHGIGYTLG